MPVHPGFVAIKPPLAPGVYETWNDPELPIFIAVALRPIAEAWHTPIPFDVLPRWVEYGGPMRMKHWNFVNDFVQKFYAAKGFDVTTRPVPIAPPEFRPWPTDQFSWAWSYETVNSPLFRLAQYPAVKYNFVRVA